MCSNQDCPLQDSCWRLNRPPAKYAQVYQNFEGETDPETEDFTCKFFIPFPEQNEDKK